MYSWQLSSLILKRVNFKYTNNNVNFSSFFKHISARIKFGGYRKKIDLWFKEQGTQVAKACTKQCEFIVAQRIRRSIQIFYLYTKIWDEVALKEIIKLWKMRVLKNSRQFLISAAGVSVYNWDRERIPDEEVNSYSQELKGIYKLRDDTVVCKKCHLRICIDNASKQPGIEYCICEGSKFTATSNKSAEGWQPYIERQDMLIWRRQEPDTGLYAYKVYGSFPDVTAEDFFQVQIDIDYRKHWDKTAKELQIIDTDPKSMQSSNDSADIIYWEMIWPKLFTNRDYVYQRRWIIDEDKSIVIIVSKGTDHPNVPIKSGTHRVKTYWSYMVIKPYKEFHQPGIEFSLTYFDDPGVSVPTAVTGWVAVGGLSDFLSRMRQASKDYKQYKMGKRNIESENRTAVDQENLAGYKDAHKEQNKTEDNKDMRENEIVEEHNVKHDEVIKLSTSFEIVQSRKEINSIEDANEEENEEENDVEENNDEDSVPPNSVSQKEQGLLNYFLLSRLFA